MPEPDIDIYQSIVVKKGDVSIVISGDPDGILATKTRDQVMMFCSDLCRQAAGEGTLEETLTIQAAIEETLKVNYGWSDIEFNEFIRVWRRNLYLMKIGKDNNVDVDLKEFQNFMTYLDHKQKVDAGESTDIGANSSDELQRFAQQAIEDQEIRDTEAKIIIDGKIVSVSDAKKKSNID